MRQSPITPEELAAERRRIKRQRRQLDSFARDRLDRRINAHLLEHPWLWSADTVAAYLSDGSEPDLDSAITTLWQRRKHVVLPGLPPFGRRMRFLQYTPETPLQHGRFGLLQPRDAALVPATRIDLVLLPLVGFDAQGNRIGQGGGFYDRAFAFRRLRRHWRHPRLVGIGYAFQQLPTLPRQSWDVPLDAAITEHGWELFH